MSVISQQLPPSPPELTEIQKADLQRLWDLQTRANNDVRPTSECGSNKPSLNDSLTFKMIKRLHSFFLTFLKSVSEEVGSSSEETSASYLKPLLDSCLESYIRLFLIKAEAAALSN
jgi:hypothetical protein